MSRIFVVRRLSIGSATATERTGHDVEGRIGPRGHGPRGKRERPALSRRTCVGAETNEAKHSERPSARPQRRALLLGSQAPLAQLRAISSTRLRLASDSPRAESRPTSGPFVLSVDVSCPNLVASRGDRVRNAGPRCPLAGPTSPCYVASVGLSEADASAERAHETSHGHDD
jgi:hypothetical protein